jgi:hypothetical protein
VRIHPGYGRESPIDLNLIRHGGYGFGIPESIEGEDDIIGSERAAVGEAHSFAEVNGIGAAIRSDLPAGGQAGFELICEPIDMYEICG